MNISVTIDTSAGIVQVQLSGTNGKWMGFGFDGVIMDGTYAMVVDGNGNFEERTLGFQSLGTLLATSCTIQSNTVQSGIRTVTLLRTINVGSAGYYTFPNVLSSIDIIWATGSTSVPNQHTSWDRGTDVINLIDVCNQPTTILPSVSICSGDSALILGQWRNQPGTYTDTLINQFGCDSITQQSLQTLANLSYTLPQVNLCNGDSAYIFGQFQHQNGWYYDTLTSSFGCDSVLSVNVHTEFIQAQVMLVGTTLNAIQSNGYTYEWFDCNDSSKMGVNTPLFTPNQNGSYFVVAFSPNCSDTSDCFTVNGIGLEEEIPNFTYSYPKPFRDELYLKNLPLHGRVILYNSEGKMFQNILIDRTSLRLNTSSWRNGTYWILIHSQDGNNHWESVIKTE